jgi:predicted DNA-binding WGR domain protein
MIYRAPLFDEDGKWNEKNLLYCEWGRTSIEALQAAHTFSDRALHAQDDGALPKYLQKKVQEYSDKLKSKARRSVKELV